MKRKQLLYVGHVKVGKANYRFSVFKCRAGRYCAETAFAPRDVIIVDGSSVREVIERHVRILPVAVDSRELLVPLERYGRGTVK